MLLWTCLSVDGHVKAILLFCHRRGSMFAIRKFGVYLRINGIVKIELRYPMESFVYSSFSGVNHYIYMNSSALIPAWINYVKLTRTIIVSSLISTKIYLTICPKLLNTWVYSLRICMPNLNMCLTKGYTLNSWIIIAFRVYCIDFDY